MQYFIGLTQWHHPAWYAISHRKNNALSRYSQYFSSVEGNHTFYGSPDQSTVNLWKETVSDDFRFCFKFPKRISHDACLKDCAQHANDFLTLISPLEHKLGMIWLQMSRHFSPSQLPLLNTFLASLSTAFHYAVEVRHLGFFNKKEEERQFNQLLVKYNINRVVVDTRTLFSNPSDDIDTQKALRKKPRVPTHVLSTADQPMVRFISPMDLKLSEPALDQWAQKLIQWIDEGKTPYIFFHTPSNQKTPQLAQRFAMKMNELRHDIPKIDLWSQQPQQRNLF
ncbi:MAG: DUF72 domain-containing protein [Cocleimonas sp.]|nr:DUF72 domain-containing protein [Cocleimonas sp.]